MIDHNHLKPLYMREKYFLCLIKKFKIMKSLFERINVGADELREGRVKTASEMLANSRSLLGNQNFWRKSMN